MTEITYEALCERLEELVASGARVTLVSAICETGANPESVLTAFRHLDDTGVATLVGGGHRSWAIVRKGGR